jgi:hypothetical protein
MEIIISGDVQRTNQASNIHTVYGLLSGVIQKVTGIQPKRIHGGEILSTNGWMVSLEKSAYLLDKYGRQDKFWIGFEFPIGFTAECDRLGIPYVDLNAHPIRFCDDLFIGVKTKADVSSFAVHNDEIEFAAALMRARSSQVPGLAMSDGALLLLGQTPFDRAVIKDGKAARLDDYMQVMIDLAKQHSMLIFKPHPHYISDEPTHLLNEMVKHAGIGCHRTNINIYKLLSEPYIKTVAALSSSVLTEAKYFGKDTIRFLPDLSDGYHPISVETICSADFWAKIFDAHGIEVKCRTSVIQHRSRNRLRQVWSSGWGYPFFGTSN